MARFLLVHGAAHGAWCWRALSAELAALGHEAVAIDLPSHGDDPTPVGEVTLDTYVAAILAALEDETVPVAHSMAGVPATCAADRAPGRVARLVYLCAYLPRDGESVASLQRRQAERPLRPAVRVAPDRLSFGFDPALAPEIFYHDCPEARVAEALDRMSPQPIAPTEAPVRLEGGIERVARSYILCTGDRAIPPAAQREMASGLHVVERPWGHSPFFSEPRALAALLDGLARG